MFIGLTILSVCLLFFALRRFETAVVFHPERYAPGNDWTIPLGGEDVWLTTSDHVRLHGWFVHSQAEAAPATVIYFHGNGGNLNNVGWVGERLAARGLDVLLLDYRGYGRSEGSVASERDIYTDADAAYDYILDQRGVPAERIVLYGQSLGTTAAIDVASRRGCGALVLESGLSSASDMAAAMFPWSPRWLHSLGKNRFESARKLSGVSCPVLITHGDPDPTIPTEQSHVLYDAARGPKKLLLFPGAGHNVVGFGGDAYLKQVADFINDAVQPEPL
ncbi:MAG TPA: alpha/beta hydrolase [Pyrinomonadaceae bacterium]|jgi:hypothetical protein